MRKRTVSEILMEGEGVDKRPKITESNRQDHQAQETEQCQGGKKARVFNRKWLQEFCGLRKLPEGADGNRNHGNEKLERLINNCSLADDEEAILIDGKETRASFMQFEYFLNSNREKSVIKLSETLVEPGAYQLLQHSHFLKKQFFRFLAWGQF